MVRPKFSGLKRHYKLSSYVEDASLAYCPYHVVWRSGPSLSCSCACRRSRFEAGKGRNRYLANHFADVPTTDDKIKARVAARRALNSHWHILSASRQRKSAQLYLCLQRKEGATGMLIEDVWFVANSCSSTLLYAVSGSEHVH